MNEKDFIFSKSRELKLSGIKNFPSDFLDSNNFNVIDIPPKELILGKEFFGKFEVSTANGDFILTFNNAFEAKYIVYASRNRDGKVKFPKEQASIINAVKNFENYLDMLLIDIKKDYQTRFKDGKNFDSVSNEIFKRVNLIRL